ncbi:protease inhibitor I9 family protein [Streptomyces sp. NPDC051677]|uniref:protease inhibitor I9 family protein n=1 Tax=Streptomyces sp. NPDC051677 TaxID=3365669 RepID=UPI0037D97E44
MASAHADLAGKPADAGTRMYLVKLADPPVATYQGGLKGLVRTAPSPGDRLKTGTNAVRAYLRHLDARRDEILDDVSGIKKVYEYNYAFNGFAALLTARQAAELSATPGVVSLTRDKADPLPPAPVQSTAQEAAGDARHPAAADGGRPRQEPFARDIAAPGRIAVGDLAARQTVTRTVTNVGTDTATYCATLQTPPGYKAQVTPQRLTVAPGGSATYRVTFTRTDAAYGTFSYGSLTWSDARSQHRVTSPIALRAAHVAAPFEIALEGERSTALTVRADWKGELTARAELYKSEKITGTLTGEDPSNFAADPHTGDAVAKVPVHVPDGAPFTRVGVYAADHVPGSKMSLYAFDGNGVRIFPGPQTGSDDYLDLPPGDYDVYVVQEDMPKGTDSQQYTLRLWKVGQGPPAVRPTVGPATRPVTPATLRGLTVTWPDAARGEQYVGIVEYGDGSRPVGLTRLAVTA